MTIAFLEGNSTGTTYAAMQLTRSLGFQNVFLTCDRSFYRGLEDDPLQIADLVIDVDTYDVIATFRAVAKLGCRAIIAFDDYHLPISSLCAQLLNLPAAPAKGLLNARFKDFTREETRHTVGCVGFQVFDVDDFENSGLKDLAFPVITKPVDESGSVRVRICYNTSEVEEEVKGHAGIAKNVRQYVPERRLLIEEFIEGPEFSCELCWSNERKGWTILGFTEKLLSGEPNFVEMGHIFPARLSAAQMDECEKCVRSWIAAIKLECAAAHVEFRIDKSGLPRLIEINPRLPGGHITELVRLCTGIDMLGAYLNYHIRDEIVELPQKRATHSHAATIFFLSTQIGCVSNTEILDRVFKTLPEIERVSWTKFFHEEQHQPKDNYGRIGHLIVASDSRAALETTLNKIHNVLLDLPRKLAIAPA